MLIGSAGVGKSSLKRGLMSLPFDVNMNSTIVADVQSVRPDIPSSVQPNTSLVQPILPPLRLNIPSFEPDISSIQPNIPLIRPVCLEWAMPGNESTIEWTEVTTEHEVEEIAQLVTIVHKQAEGHGTPTATAKFQQTPLEKRINRIIGSEILAPAFGAASKMRHNDIEHIKPQPFYHIWDCGGQPVFQEVLPAFLTSRTMFLLLFDASIDFSTRLKAIQYQQGQMIEEGEVNMTTLELMEGWMSNIHGRLVKYDDEGGLLEYPRIIAVGSRGDKLTEQEKIEVKEKLDKCLRDTSHDQKDKQFLQILKGNVIIDNTTSGKGIEEDIGYKYLRKEIYDFTSKKLVVRTPIKWVLFRKVLQSLVKKSENMITMREACAIGVACRIAPEDVPSVLKFYHELGVVLFYSRIKGLQEKVILNPKWFVECLGKVLTLPGTEGFEKREMWNLLRQKGILVQPLYVAVWKEFEGIDPEEMVQLLISFHLAAEVQTDEFGQRRSKQFFVPAILPTGDPSSALPPGYQLRASPLHITFGTGYVIPGFFTRLVTSMAESSQCSLYFRDGIFRNRVTFKFAEINRVTLTQLSNAIQVDLLRYIPNSSALTPFHKSCKDLQVSRYV